MRRAAPAERLGEGLWRRAVECIFGMYPEPTMNDHPWLSQYDAGVPATLEPYPARTLLDYVDDAVAFVVPRMGHTVTAAELRAWCKDHLAPFKVPARVVFRDELPKSMVGKVLRRLLAEDPAPVA